MLLTLPEIDNLRAEARRELRAAVEAAQCDGADALRAFVKQHSHSERGYRTHLARHRAVTAVKLTAREVEAQQLRVQLCAANDAARDSALKLAREARTAVDTAAQLAHSKMVQQRQASLLQRKQQQCEEYALETLELRRALADAVASAEQQRAAIAAAEARARDAEQQHAAAAAAAAAAASQTATAAEAALLQAKRIAAEAKREAGAAVRAAQHVQAQLEIEAQAKREAEGAAAVARDAADKAEAALRELREAHRVSEAQVAEYNRWLESMREYL